MTRSENIVIKRRDSELTKGLIMNPNLSDGYLSDKIEEVGLKETIKFILNSKYRKFNDSLNVKMV